MLHSIPGEQDEPEWRQRSDSSLVDMGRGGGQARREKGKTWQRQQSGGLRRIGVGRALEGRTKGEKNGSLVGIPMSHPGEPQKAMAEAATLHTGCVGM